MVFLKKDLTPFRDIIQKEMIYIFFVSEQLQLNSSHPLFVPSVIRYHFVTHDERGCVLPHLHGVYSINTVT